MGIKMCEQSRVMLNEFQPSPAPWFGCRDSNPHLLLGLAVEIYSNPHLLLCLAVEIFVVRSEARK